VTTPACRCAALNLTGQLNATAKLERAMRWKFSHLKNTLACQPIIGRAGAQHGRAVGHDPRANGGCDHIVIGGPKVIMSVSRCKAKASCRKQTQCYTG